MLDLKLFLVKQTDYGWGWQKIIWEQYIFAKDECVLKENLIKNYGTLSKYYREDDQESHITYEELEFEVMKDENSDYEDK